MKKILSAASVALATLASPQFIIPTVVTTSIAITTVAADRANAGSFPGFGKVLQDTLPCVDPLGRDNCIYLQERVNIFQGLGKSKPALEYCRQKYGSDATVVWKLGLRWCATSSSM
jgi:hypothetical protein